MSYNALFIGWERVNPGREDDAVQLAKEVEKLLKGKQSGVDEFTAVYLVPGGSNQISGFYLIKGDRERIDELSASEDFVNLSARLSTTAQGLRISRGYVDSEAQDQLDRFKVAARAAR